MLEDAPTVTQELNFEPAGVEPVVEEATSQIVTSTEVGAKVNLLYSVLSDRLLKNTQNQRRPPGFQRLLRGRHRILPQSRDQVPVSSLRPL